MRQWALKAVIVAAFSATRTACFTPSILKTSRSFRLVLSSSSVPSLEQLSSDPFMEQLSHASDIVQHLTENTLPQEQMTERLVAQLSHSDGIRGFFATYLTGEGAADQKNIPTPLRKAMQQADPQELIPLACMNVIMPTAMSTMHTDPTLREASLKTAERGTRILRALSDHSLAKRNIVAIRAASLGKEWGPEADLVEYWTKFFHNYGYGTEQLKDIANAFAEYE